MRILEGDLQLVSVRFQRAQEVLGEAAWKQHVKKVLMRWADHRVGGWGAEGSTHPARLCWTTGRWCPRSGSCWSRCTGCSASSWCFWSPVAAETKWIRLKRYTEGLIKYTLIWLRVLTLQNHENRDSEGTTPAPTFIIRLHHHLFWSAVKNQSTNVSINDAAEESVSQLIDLVAVLTFRCFKTMKYYYIYYIKLLHFSHIKGK